MTPAQPYLCPHCQVRMVRWANPEGSTWGGDFQYVCFNDDCLYFVGGWAWMSMQYSARASYRYRLDPVTGETGPLPVWSRQALRDRIICDEELEAAHAG